MHLSGLSDILVWFIKAMQRLYVHQFIKEQCSITYFVLEPFVYYIFHHQNQTFLLFDRLCACYFNFETIGKSVSEVVLIPLIVHKVNSFKWSNLQLDRLTAKGHDHQFKVCCNIQSFVIQNNWTFLHSLENYDRSYVSIIELICSSRNIYDQLINNGSSWAPTAQSLTLYFLAFIIWKAFWAGKLLQTEPLH